MEEYIYWRDDALKEDETQIGIYYRSMGLGKFIKECEDKGFKMLGIKFNQSNDCEFLFIPPEKKETSSE